MNVFLLSIGLIINALALEIISLLLLSENGFDHFFMILCFHIEVCAVLTLVLPQFLTPKHQAYQPLNLLSIALIFNALILEIISFLLLSEQGFNHFFMILCFHIEACAVLTLVLPQFLMPQHQTYQPLNLLFFFLLAFFMPVLGMLGLILAVIPGLRYRGETEAVVPIKFNSIRELSNTPMQQIDHFEYGAVSLENLLRSKDPNKRMNAVYATLKLDDKEAIPLLRTALRDPVDDIRLLAYALIDRKEQRISERIEKAKENLENNPRNKRHLYKCIIQDYWELAHLGLVEGETLNFVLNKTCEYLEQALKLYPKDRGLRLQYAKLLLRLNQPETALDEFKMAEALGISKKQLLLYYAEIDFLQRRYSEVKQYMKELDFATDRPQIQAAKQFWQEKY